MPFPPLNLTSRPRGLTSAGRTLTVVVAAALLLSGSVARDFLGGACM